MYQYDEHDRRRLAERLAQFREQVALYLAGALSEAEFRPLRLQHGLYVLRRGPMLRVAIPYGVASSAQLRRLAQVSRSRGLGPLHLTTRQNVQFNGPRLAEVPDILDELAEVHLHGFRTSGHCVRAITADPLAGAAPDERDDPRPWCELLRQWCCHHPDFAQLPRKFKIAVSGTRVGRSLLLIHDLGLELVRDDRGELGFRALAGGGLGRWPMLGQELTPFVAWPQLLTYVEAILRVYDRHGRRDDPAKGRLKVLVRTLGLDAFRQLVEEEWAARRGGPGTLTADEVARVARHFAAPALDPAAPEGAGAVPDPDHGAWLRHNVGRHRHGGYAIVTLSTKGAETAPGDLTPEQLERLADWADAYGFGEVRFTQRQNPVLAHVRRRDLPALWQAARRAGLGAANAGLLTDLVACPGGRDCDLSTVETQPVAAAIQRHFAARPDLAEIGALSVNLSGCVNGCAHHQLGHIGLRGVEKQGLAYFQIAIGGQPGRDTRLGELLGPAVAADRVPAVIDTLVATYRGHRLPGETFSATVQRIGTTPFHDDLHGPEPGAGSAAQDTAEPFLTPNRHPADSAAQDPAATFQTPNRHPADSRDPAPCTPS